MVASRIDIDGLTEAELIDLNNRIVERLRFFHQARAILECSNFRSVIAFLSNPKEGSRISVCSLDTTRRQ